MKPQFSTNSLPEIKLQCLSNNSTEHAISLPEINNNIEIENSDKANNKVLVFENGTVLGAVIMSNFNNQTNNNVNSARTVNTHNNQSNLMENISNSSNFQKQLNNNDSSSSCCDISKNENNNIQNSEINKDSHSTSSNNLNNQNYQLSQNDATQNILEVTTNQNNNILENEITLQNPNENDITDLIASNILDSSLQTDNIDLQIQDQSSIQLDSLNLSTCSRESNKSKKSRRKSNMKKSQHDLYSQFQQPPQYTAIYIDNGIGFNGNQTSTHLLTASGGLHNQIQQYDSGNNGVPVVQRTQIDAVSSGCFQKWFKRRPSLPFVIGTLALGGVACTLGGIVLGSTGLIEHSTQYLSAALLMIGIGVSLLVISGAIWRLSIPDEVDNCPCFRHLETCRNCNSPFCGNRFLSATSYMYPEFQHRPPPPSYLTSVNECTVGLLLHHDLQNFHRNEQMRIATPPPAYRSTNSLSAMVPLHNCQIATNLSMTSTNNDGAMTDNIIDGATLSTVNNPITLENLKEIS